jgi:hypothetical protein
MKTLRGVLLVIITLATEPLVELAGRIVTALLGIDLPRFFALLARGLI